MKKQISKRLQLNKQTLRNLSERELDGVVGGAGTTRCCGTTSGCTYVTDTCFACTCSCFTDC
jgi:hypothetical protein